MRRLGIVVFAVVGILMMALYFELGKRTLLGTVTTDVTAVQPAGTIIYTKHNRRLSWRWPHERYDDYCYISEVAAADNAQYEVSGPPLRDYKPFRHRMEHRIAAYIPPFFAADGTIDAVFEARTQSEPAGLFIHESTPDVFNRVTVLAQILNVVDHRDGHCKSNVDTGERIRSDLLDRMRPELEAWLPIWLADPRRVRRQQEYDTEVVRVSVTFIRVLGEDVLMALSEGIDRE